MVSASLDQTSILRILGLTPLQTLLLEYGVKYLMKSKEQTPLQFLKVKLKNGFYMVVLVGFTKYIFETSGLYIINLLIFDGNPNILFSRCKLLKKTIKLRIIRNRFSDETKNK